jgi:hypothetical protein
MCFEAEFGATAVRYVSVRWESAAR